MNVGPLLLQTLIGSAGSVVAAVVGYILTRQLRAVLGSAEATEERAANAEASAGNAAADASSTKDEIERLTTIVGRQAAAIEDMAHRYDNVWSKFLTNEVLDMRLKRVERYLAEHELDRKQTEILSAFSGPIPTTIESSNA